MAYPEGHFKSDGTCDCDKDGRCGECNKPCTDHDLVACWYWCEECIDRHLKEDADANARP